MIIDLKTAFEGSRHFDFCLGKDWLPKDGPADCGFEIDQPLSVSLDLYRAGDKYIFEGKFQGGVQLECDRCLEPFHHDLDVSFREVLLVRTLNHEEADRGLAEEDLEFDVVKDDAIDLADMIREQIYLNLPMKLICRDDCQGLCPRCGINLNLKTCSCQLDQGHPGFQALKTLNLKHK